jgi:hypothetical protein
MSHPREPTIHSTPILELRPTQMTVGMREVDEKRKRFRKMKADKKNSMIGKHMVPVVRGPNKRFYVVDHHHLCRALHEEGIKDIFVTVIGDLTMVEREEFWGVMDNKRWVFPYDARGERRQYKDLPKSIVDLKDDPYRSLAGELRRDGYFAKDTTPFSEFLWADFLRRRIPHATVEKRFAEAKSRAEKLARSKDAVFLPGWCGPASDG